MIAAVGSCAGSGSDDTASIPDDCNSTASCIVVVETDGMPGIDLDREVLMKLRPTLSQLADTSAAKIQISLDDKATGLRLFSLYCLREELDRGGWGDATVEDAKRRCQWVQEQEIDA